MHGYNRLIDARGEVATRSRYDEQLRTWKVLIADQGDDVVVERKTALASASVQGPGRTEGTILVRDDHDQTNTTWEEFPIAPKAQPTLLFDGADVGRILRDPVTDLIIGYSDPSEQKLHFLDPTLQHRFDAAEKAFAKYHVALQSYASDMKRMVIRTDGGDDPGT